MPRKRRQPGPVFGPLVIFQFEERVYQIDPREKKVYRRHVEIETSKAAEILSTWRSDQQSL